MFFMVEFFIVKPDVPISRKLLVCRAHVVEATVVSIESLNQCVHTLYSKVVAKNAKRGDGIVPPVVMLCN